MKGKNWFTLCLLMLISLISCGKSDNCTDIELDSLFQFQEGDSFCLPTGIEFEVVKFDDQRCPCDAVCIWEGEFVFEILIRSNGFEEEYLLHEKLDNEASTNNNLVFSEIVMISDDSCENVIDIDKLIFEMKVNQ